MSYSNGLVNFKNKNSGQGERVKPGVGFNLTSDGNYDMVNKKLVNVADGTDPKDAITLGKPDAVDIDTITKNIDL